MVYEKRYQNGLRLVVKRMEGLLSVSAGILVGTGAAAETDEEDGVSHFIEHMQFKGTTTRSAFRISDAFDRIGAQVNAFTGKDATCYYTKATSDHIADAFEVLADLFLNATYPEDEMEREKGVVCEEIAMNEDTPDDLCLDLLSTAIYGKENYGRNILGTVQNVKGFTREAIERYKTARYCPENIVVSFAGGIDFETAVALVENTFGNLKQGKFEKREPKLSFSYQSLYKKKPIEQTHIGVAFPAVSRDDKLEGAMQTVSGVLGGSMSSRLFQEVREKLGLAYSVYSYLSSYRECGHLIVYAGVNPANAQKAYEAIVSVTQEMYRNGISEEEFLRGREQMKSSMLFSQESTSSQMLLYGKHMLFNDSIFDFEGKLSSINAITADDIGQAVETAFASGRKALGVIGSTDQPIKA